MSDITPSEARVLRFLRAQPPPPPPLPAPLPPPEVYLSEASSAIMAAVEQVLIDRPEDPIAAISAHLAEQAAVAKVAAIPTVGRASTAYNLLPPPPLAMEQSAAGSSTAQVDLLFSHSPEVAALAVDAADALAVGDSEASVELFDAILAIDQTLSPLLWQRGLALFYNGQYAEASAQFVRDVVANGSDVEEVVWHHLCLCRCTARPPPLLPCGDDDRAVMGRVKALFELGEAADGEAARRLLVELTTAPVDAAPADGAEGERTLAASRAYGRFYAGLWLQIVRARDSVDPLAACRRLGVPSRPLS